MADIDALVAELRQHDALMEQLLGRLAILRAQYQDRSGQLKYANQSQILVPANPARSLLVFQNVSAQNLGIIPNGQQPSIGAAGTITVVPAGTYVMDPKGVVDTSQWNIIGGAAGLQFTCFEV